MLRQGVELYELRPDNDNRIVDEAGADPVQLTLHSKVAIVDRARLFVGSFNLDPRSLYINTELGVVVESPQMAASMASAGLQALRLTAYQLKLNGKGRLNWHYTSRGQGRIATREPDTSLWRRFLTRLMGWLPIEGQM